MISPTTAPHYLWADICDGWKLVDTPSLSVIQERMPPDTAETRHRHSRVRQFFYVLGGELTLEVEGVAEVLKPGQGLEIAPGRWHQARNEGGVAAEFLVISDGVSREDREDSQRAKRGGQGMTTREEIKAKLDTLSDAAFEEVVKIIERQTYAERQMAALRNFAEGWTPEEEAAWLEGTKRRPWRTGSTEDAL